MCGALLDHYNSAGKSQFNQHCHTRIAHTLVSVVMETAASQGVGKTPVSSPCVLHVLSEYLSTVLSNSLPQLLQCTSEENEEVCVVRGHKKFICVKCMLTVSSTGKLNLLILSHHCNQQCSIVKSIQLVTVNVKF